MLGSGTIRPYNEGDMPASGFRCYQTVCPATLPGEMSAAQKRWHYIVEFVSGVPSFNYFVVGRWEGGKRENERGTSLAISRFMVRFAIPAQTPPKVSNRLTPKDSARSPPKLRKQQC